MTWSDDDFKNSFWLLLWHLCDTDKGRSRDKREETPQQSGNRAHYLPGPPNPTFLKISVIRQAFGEMLAHCTSLILFFSLLMWCITVFGLQILKNPCIPGLNPIWPWCMIFLMCVGFGFLVFSWGFLHLCSSVLLVCNFPFLWYLRLILIRVMVAS